MTESPAPACTVTAPARTAARDAFTAAWEALDPAPRRSLELAHRALRSGGLAVGSVLTDACGMIVAEGRNRAYDAEAEGAEILRGTPLAHAEMNALARARTGWDLAVHTLWSTQEPCSMCAAAAEFTGVGAVRFLAADPWATATGRPSASARARLTAEPVWRTAATVLFLRSVVEAAGPEAETVRRMAETDPVTTAIATDDGFPDAQTPELLLGALWGSVAAAADRLA
ncbi:nucleoside deaminase [Streptomyces sp. NPDC056222]|uniref:nucleoside deaminase n=1 Tax=Streptomyces sp. NPDC056222 TaxID=3345749 RepID=UPI0035DE703B